MTVANTNVSSTYNCNGVTREWNIGFHYNSTLSGLSIVVLHADGTSTDVTANYEIESGVLTYPTVESELDPLPEGDVITITRITPLTQNINLVQQGPLDAETLESGYDKATLQIQEVFSKKQDKLKPGANIVIEQDGTISATGEIVEGVSWGNVHGTLANQTDLLTVLNSKADVSDLATVATTGDYEDLLNQPTIPTDTEDLTNGAGYQTASDVSSAITGKANIDLSNVTKPYVTETYVNGTSWYRVWSDGWCEQGGDLVLNQGSYTFLKQYDSMPRVMIQVYTNNSSGATNEGAAQLTAMPSNSGFTTAGTPSAYYEGGWWFAYGYIN